MFAPRDVWVWDFWLTEHLGVYHLYYLHAPKALGDPELRHTSAKIGHATSNDLVDWQDHGLAFGPGDSGSWDDLATWTGSVLRVRGGWEMFYTGIGRTQGRAIQSIGVATSDDLFHWRKAPENPVSVHSPRWYETYPDSGWHNQAWRDPWVYFDENGDRRMLITARDADVSLPLANRGVVATAVQDTEGNWVSSQPLVTPRISGDIEVPQLFEVDGVWYLLFCTVRPSNVLKANGVDGCVVGYFRGSSADGPFEWSDRQVLASGEEGLFGPRVVKGPDGELLLLAWQRVDSTGSFGGWITDPMPLEVTQGSLQRR